MSRHLVEPLGLTIETHAPWVLRTTGAGERGGVFQRVGDGEGVVFVRWGPDETVDDFVPRLSDYLTTATVVGDDEVTFRGRPARRLRARTEREAVRVHRPGPHGMADAETPARASEVTAYGLLVRGTPVLVGSIVVDGTPATDVAVVERLVESVEWPD